MTELAPAIAARTMYDSTEPAAIPPDAEIVAGYVDGSYRWSDADWNRFATSVKVGIATQPSTNEGTVLDVELGDATPEQAPAWIRMRQADGVPQPTIYCGLSAVGRVREACKGLLYWLWVADWTGSPHPVSYAAAVQYANSAQAGGHFDLSIVYTPQWPGPFTPPSGGVDPMDLDTARTIVHTTLSLQGILGDQAQVDSYASQMVPPNNPEVAATNLENDIKADPRSLYSRTVAHLNPPAGG
jgi:hypothetical protein